MADKKSFVFYHEWGEILKKLPVEEVGNITLALITYSECGIIPTLSPIADIAFTAFKQVLDHDYEKWESVCQKNAENGKKGGRPPKPSGFSENINKPNGFSENPNKVSGFSKKPKKADYEYEYDIDCESDKYTPNGSPPPHSKSNIQKYEEQNYTRPMQNDTNTMQNQSNESNGDTNLCTNTNTNTNTITKTETAPTLANSDENKPKKPKKSAPEKKKVYADYVSLTEEEYFKLINQYGEEATRWCIQKLDNYKGSTGKKYASDYRTILSWVIGSYQEEQAKHKQPAAQSRPPGAFNTGNPFLDMIRNLEEQEAKEIVVQGNIANNGNT